MALTKRIPKGSKINATENDDNMDWLNQAGTKTAAENLTFDRGGGWIHGSTGDLVTVGVTIDETGLLPGTWAMFYYSGATNPTITGASGTVTEYHTITTSGTYECWLIHKSNGDYTLSIPQASGGTVTLPVLTSAVVEDAAPSNLVLTYNKALDAASTPLVTDFAITADAVANVATNVVVGGTIVTITVTTPFASGEVILCNYTAGLVANRIKDTSANEASNLVNQAVTNNVVGSGGIEASGYTTKYDPSEPLINSADLPASNGDAIKTVTALGTAPIDFTALSGLEPTLITNVLNTHPVLRFLSNDEMNAVAAMGLGNNLTMIMVAMSTTAMTSAVESPFGKGVNTSNRLNFSIDTRVGVSGGRFMGLSTDGTGTVGMFDTTLTDLAPSTFEVSAIGYELGSRQRMWKNGTLVDTKTLTGTGYVDTDWAMGRIASANYSGDIAIIYCWDSLLSDTDIVNFSNELVTKYGL